MIQDTLYFRNAMYRVLHERSYIVAFFTVCLEFPGKKMSFVHEIWGSIRKLKSKNNNQNILHFENAAYRMLHERYNVVASLTEHLEFSQQINFRHAMWLKLVPANFYQIFIFPPNDSPLKTMKNVFCFI